MTKPEQTRPTKRARKSPLILVLLSVLFFLAGCGSSGNDFVATGSGVNPPPTPDPIPRPGPTDLVVNFDLASARGVVAASVTDFRFSGFNAQDGLVLGPVTRAKAAQVTLQNVPTTMVELRIEYLNGSIIVGQSVVDVSIVEGESNSLEAPDITPVNLSKITVTPGTAQVIVGQSQQFSASGDFSNGATENISADVQWSAGTPGIATVDASGRATGEAGGSSTVVATFGSVSGSAQLTVSSSNPLESVEVTAPRDTLGVGFTLQLEAEAVLEDGTRIDVTADASWSSSNDAVASVDPTTGLVTGEAAGGPVTISAAFEGQTGTTDITVVALTLESIEISPAEATTIVGLTADFTAMGTFTDGTETTETDITTDVTWGSGDEAVAEIGSSTGVATAITAGGPIDITAVFGEGEDAVEADPAQLTVSDATIQSITVTPVNVEEATIPRFFNIEFRAVATLDNNTEMDVTEAALWTSSDQSVAVFNGGSTFFSFDPGETTILARQEGINSTPLTLTVINSNLLTVTVTPPSQTITRGGGAQYQAEATYQNLNGGPDVLVDVTRGQGTAWFSDNGDVLVQNGFASHDQFANIAEVTQVLITANFQGIPDTAELILDPREITAIEINGVGATDTARLGDIPAGYGRMYSAMVAFDGGELEPLPTSMVSAWELTNDTGTMFLQPDFETGWALVQSDGSPEQTETLSLNLGDGEVLAVTSDDGTNALNTLAADFAQLPEHRVIPLGGIRALEVIGTFVDGLVFEMPANNLVIGPSLNVGQTSFGLRLALRGDGTTDPNADPAETVDVIVEDTSSALQDTVDDVQVLVGANFRAEPANASVQVDQTQPFTALIDYTDGEANVDVTALVNFWFSSNPVVVIDRSGLATARAIGTASLSPFFPGVGFGNSAELEVTP